MAFSFGNPGGAGLGASSVKQLLEIDTEAVEFHAIAQDAKVQLMQAWPSDQLPPPTSSLLAIASKRELLAAGGPTSVVVASIEAVRNAFSGEGSGDIKSFTPQLTLTLGTRISQVAFSSDESLLAISAEQGGGLAVYEVDNLLKGNTNTSFELGTGQVAVRALIPNPGIEMASLFAIVNANGQLMIADMKARQLGNPFKDSVSCVAWSTKGKQLVAGLGDGSAVQMTPTGEVVKQIARPPDVQANRHVSAISWLDNFTFFMIHTSSDSSDPTSDFHIVITDKAGNCEYQKLPEVIGTFGLERYPPSIFVQRLKEFPPNLKEVLMLASTASEDVGLVTKATKPLISGADAAQTTDTFTTTTISNNSRRAALPMADEMTNSSPIGMAIDLSSKTPVRRPLPMDEMDESPTPLPALFILNNMGVLAGWWFIYTESLKTATAYPGLVHAGVTSTPQQASGSTFGASGGSAFGSALKPAATGFGFSSTPTSTAPTFGQNSVLVASQPAFGQQSTLGASQPTFGSPSILNSSTPAFSVPSTGTARASPWGAQATSTGTSAFGKPSFGQTSFGKPAVSPWAAASSGNSNTGATGGIFGQSSGSTPQNSVFGSATQTNTETGNKMASGSGFASFANTGGFASAGKGPSVFASQAPSNTFGSNTESSSIFGTPSTSNKTGGVFGSSTSGFNLGSGWKNDQPKETAKAEAPGPSSLFGSDFGKTLVDTAEQPVPARSEERDMEDEMSDAADTSIAVAGNRSAISASITPVKTPAPPTFTTTTPSVGGLFGTQNQDKQASTPAQSNTPTLSLTTTPATKTTLNSDLPLPPDTTSKATFTPATSSENSADGALKATSDAAQSSSSPVEQSTEQNPSVPSDKAHTVTATPAKSPKPITPMNISNVASSPSGLFAIPKLPEKTATTISPSLFPSTTPPSNPVKASDEESKSPSSSEPEQKDSVTTVEDGEDEEEYDDDDFEDEEEEEEEGQESHEDDEEDEGSGIDVAKEIGAGASFDDSTKSSFGRQSSGLTETSWANVVAPRSQPSQPRRDILEKVRFPPTQPDNERSPSPERRQAPGFLRSDGSRSLSAPNVAAKPNIALTAIAKSRKSQNTSFEQQQQIERERRANAAAQRQAQEEQSLEDDEDEAIRQLLATDVQPSKVLEPFLAHQDYTALVSKAGVPGQIEKIYKDINSMVDTVGLNSRSLQAFIKGHEEVNHKGRRLDDLRTAKHWTVGEIGELRKLQQELEAKLHDAQLRQVPEKMMTLSGLQNQLKNLLRQKREINAITRTQFESAAEDEQHRNLDLSFDQQSQRQALRAKWKDFQDRLCETESSISMLKTKLVSAVVGSRKGSTVKVPTVEAVERTIRKMTRMAEEKSGDVDVLELQLRKLNIHPGTPSSSRHGSPFVTPQSSIHAHNASLRSDVVNGASPLRNTLHSSINGLERSLNLGSSYGAPRNKKLDEYTEEDVQPFVRRSQRSQVIMGHLRDALVGKNGEKTVKVMELADLDYE